MKVINVGSYLNYFDQLGDFQCKVDIHADQLRIKTNKLNNYNKVLKERIKSQHK